MELFKLPRKLGETPEGEPVEANIGRFGPYVKFGNKFASLGKDDDPYTVELPRALEIIEVKKLAEKNRIINEFDDGIQVLNGRYGPYVTDGNKNAKIPKDDDPKAITHEQAIEMIAKAPERKGRGRKAAPKAAAKKGTTTKTAAKSTTKTTAKKTASKTTTKKAPAKKTPAKKTTTRKTAAKKSTPKSASGDKAE